jgi:hypothetical protein
MGGSSGRRLALIEAFFFVARPFDTKIITAGVGITHVDVGYIAIPEQPLELGLDDTIGNIPLRNQSPTRRIGIESEAVGKHIHREAGILGVTVAIVLMDENGPRQRKLLLSPERIVGKQYPAFTTDGKGSQALAARAVSGGQFSMCGMIVPR